MTIYETQSLLTLSFCIISPLLNGVFVCLCVVALPTVTGLQLFDVTHSTMKANWDSVDGVSGYMVLYGPLIEGGQPDEKEVLKNKENI